MNPIGIVGTVGETAIVPQSLAGWNVARAIAVLPVQSDVGAKLPILLPPKPERERIEALVGALDRKIELNHRMNETLETMARAIFKDWFVDFGPTRAKREGHAPYLAPEIWVLFPDRLDDEGNPAGWKNGTLAEYASLNPESWSRSNYPARIQYVDLSGTKWGTIESIELLARDHAPSRAQRILRRGDTIVGMVRPGNGSYAFIGKGGLTGSTGFAVLRPKQFDARELIYLSSTTLENIERLAHLADGAAYPAIRPEVVLATQVVNVPPLLLKAFSTTTGPLIDRLVSNQEESAALAATRDLLLPKLMSGEIRVKDADKKVEAVAVSPGIAESHVEEAALAWLDRPWLRHGERARHRSGRRRARARQAIVMCCSSSVCAPPSRN